MNIHQLIVWLQNKPHHGFVFQREDAVWFMGVF